MSRRCFLGIDTSNYTTSLSLVGEMGELYANLKAPLTVAAGERGLRQSDALFLHTKNFPDLFVQLEEILNVNELQIVAVGVSTRPRNQDGSYMPCFLAGKSAAYAVSSTSGVPLFEFSHQCGHIAAAIYSASAPELFSAERIGAFHVSGGTTELLLAHPVANGFNAEILGGSLDLNAGQAIDRIGVKMEFGFPCGPALERAALENSKRIPKSKISIKDGFFNLSGIENKATELFEQTGDQRLVSAYVLDFVGRSIVSASLDFIEKQGDMPMVYAGGVMSNSIIKSMIRESIPDSYFAEPAMSADNAVGIAVLTRRSFCQK